MGANKNGLQYYKYNRDEYKVEFPTRVARPIGNRKGTTGGWQETYQFNRSPPDYNEYVPMQDDDPDPLRMTVGQIKSRLRGKLHELGTDAEKEAHAREAATAWIRKQQTIRVLDTNTRQTDNYHIVVNDSPIKYVWDETRPIRITRVAENVYDRSNPTADEILERPLRNFFVVPENCYRPWDLHPKSLVKDGACVVTMLFECFVQRRRKRVNDVGRIKCKTFSPTPQLEEQLGQIFVDLGYVAGACPSEGSWRTDGCTSKMILAFCKKNNIICHIFHGSVKVGNLVDYYVPEKVNSNTAKVDFFIFDDHCFWYGKDVGDLGKDRSSAAANGISQMWKKKTWSNEDEDEFAEFACKETPQLFAHANKTPPFSEWQGAHELIKAAPKFEAFEGAGSTKYFYDTDLEYVAMRLKEHQQNGERSLFFDASDIWVIA